MNTMLVKDLMIPIDEYAVVSEDATLLDAVIALDAAQSNVPKGRQQHRAVLVIDKNGKAVGKLGHLAFLKALEPKYNVLGDLGTLSRAGLSPEFISSMMDNLMFWQDSLTNICKHARTIKVKSVMHPVTESIDENAPISEAIHKIIMWQSLSILVKRGSEIVGILRVSDLFAEISKRIKNCASEHQH